MLIKLCQRFLATVPVTLQTGQNNMNTTSLHLYKIQNVEVITKLLSYLSMCTVIITKQNITLDYLKNVIATCI